MATTKNLCAQIPIDLHERVSEERERLGQTTSEYIANLIQDYQEAERYTKRLLSAIAESGLDVRAMPAVFLGGGATLLKHHASAADGLCRPIILDDVCLNAKGYERLTERMSKKHEQ